MASPRWGPSWWTPGVTGVRWTPSSWRDINSTDFMFNVMAFKKWRWWIPDCCGCNLRHIWQISGNLGWDCESWPISWFCPIWDFLSHISTMDWLDWNQIIHIPYTQTAILMIEIQTYSFQITALLFSPSFQLFVNLESRVYTMGEDNWLGCNLV